MKTNQLYLFKDRRFLPLFIIQFCGAFNDCILKNALIMLITFKLANSLTASPQMLVFFANVIFILPFVIFASLSGQLADKYERQTLIRIIKIIEVFIVMLSMYGFYHENLPILFTSIALMGIHSTFFGPIKFSAIPDHLKKEELLGGNGFIETGTFLAILIGTLFGGLYNYYGNLVMVTAFTVAITGAVATIFMPKSNNSNEDIVVSSNLFASSKNIVSYAYSKKLIYLAILGISWFWFIGAAILAQIPSYAKDILGADEGVANLFLATFSIGVAVGSFWCNRLYNNEITTKYVFIASLGLSICIFDLYLASKIAAVHDTPLQLKTITQFLSRWHYRRIIFDLFFMSALAGLYVVPLYAVMQHFGSSTHRSRIIAACNLMNAIFMAASTVTISILFFLQFSIPSIILVIGFFNLIVAIHIYNIVPESKFVPIGMWQIISKALFNLLYDVEVKGLENYQKAGKRTIIIANHLSYIDPALIATYMPGEIIFAINTHVAKEWWVRPFLKIVKTFPVVPNNPMSVKAIIDQIKQNKVIAIFPEGRISDTGSLMKIYEGPGMIADKTNATILPIRIDGTQFTRFSKLRNVFTGGFKLRKKLTMTVMPPVKFMPHSHLDQRDRRGQWGQALYDIMSDMIFDSSDHNATIFQSIIDASKIYGKNKQIAEDVDNNTATYRDLLCKSFIISNITQQHTKPKEIVGIMLPNAVATNVIFLGLQAAGRVTAMINFTAGANNILSACRTTRINVIYTAHKFIEKANLENVIETLKKANIKIIYVDKLKNRISLFIKLKCFVASFLPQTYYDYICKIKNAELPAVILFTSGTEGAPKAVALSHCNIQANRHQVTARIDFNPYDIAFNALPMFHSFGLTVSIIMLASGIRTFFYPSPLHYRIIPEIIYDISATIMIATDTFLNGYAKYAHPYDFYSLRMVVAGAEKLKSKTRDIWFKKYGVRIFEGYGVTEASPVISVCTPMHNKIGSVGRLLPKIKYFLQDVEGIENGGLLCVQGPNIMLGYIKPDQPGVILPPFVEKLGQNWYNTGDIVSVDDSGYITILGRYKRFAKIAGEMVSLAAVEEVINNIDPINSHVTIAIDDEKKGEQIILFTTNDQLTRETIIREIKEYQISELYIPRYVKYLETLPILATGKVNYRQIVEMAIELFGHKEEV